MYSYVRLSIDRCTATTSEHRSMYSYVRLSIDDDSYVRRASIEYSYDV